MQESNPPLPFNIFTDEELSSWRANTFWTKEPETLAWIHHFVTSNENLHFIDVGANIGLYSLYALSISQTLKVTSVEPSNNNFPALERNLSLNPNWQERMSCIKVPLSDSPGHGFWEEVSERVGDSGHQFSRTRSPSALSVETLTGDSLIATRAAGRKTVVKVDVDGNEVSILKGFAGSLKSGLVLSVLVELDKDQLSFATGFLLSFGLLIDKRFDSVPGHSSIRRQKSGSSVRNYVFSSKIV